MMEYEAEAIKEFNEYCREKRQRIAALSDEEQKALQEKVLVARSLLHHEAKQMALAYARYTAFLEEKGDGDDNKTFLPVQEAMVNMVCAGLEDTAFNKWKANLADMVYQVQETGQVKRLPRFSRTCQKVQDSLDIDFADIEDELKMIFEPECIYNTLVLLITAVKSYCEILDRICERHKN